MEYQKNSKHQVTITDMGTQGEGIGKLDGFPLFVKDAVVGDTVEALITKSKKNYAYARCEKVLVPSPFRVLAPCDVHRQCGGCQIMALSYEKQLALKQEKVKNHLLRIGGFEETLVDGIMEPIIGMKEPLGYRNKAQYPIGRDKNGRVVAGFYAGRTHAIIPNTRCLLGASSDEQILKAVIAFMEEFGVAPYDERTQTGLVRHVLIRTGFSTGEVMVCLVINGEKLPNADILAQRLCALEMEHKVTSVCCSVNTENTNVIMGQEIIPIFGEGYITDSIGELTFRISPLSFFQVNPVQTKALYDAALSFAGLTGKETVWDLYCGIGTISLFLAQKAGMVYGVEVIEQAIEDARENAALNGMENTRFFVGKAEEVLPRFYEGHADGEQERAKTDMSAAQAGGEYVPGEGTGHLASPAGSADMLHPDVIVVDPPRKGCDPACLDTMLKMSPDRIVYVSCDSATLARDLKILCEGGYRLEHIQPVDMFPMTVHVETVILLTKIND